MLQYYSFRNKHKKRAMISITPYDTSQSGATQVVSWTLHLKGVTIDGAESICNVHRPVPYGQLPATLASSMFLDSETSSFGSVHVEYLSKADVSVHLSSEC